MVTLDDTANSVLSLKRNIKDEQGISIFAQQLFLVPNDGSNAIDASADAKQEPVGDNEFLLVDCCMVLYIDTAQEVNCWDCSSSLITVSFFPSILVVLWNNWFEFTNPGCSLEQNIRA